MQLHLLLQVHQGLLPSIKALEPVFGAPDGLQLLHQLEAHGTPGHAAIHAGCTRLVPERTRNDSSNSACPTVLSNKGLDASRSLWTNSSCRPRSFCCLRPRSDHFNPFKSIEGTIT